MNAKKIIISLLAGWGIGISLSFIHNVFILKKIYTGHVFDLFFDWLGLLSLSIASLIIIIKEEYHERNKINEEEW